MTAYAYQRKDSPRWWVRYDVPPDGKLLSEGCPVEVTDKADAVEFARHRRELAWIDADDAPRRKKREPLTIEAAAMEHPATAREQLGRPAAVKQHEEGLRRFLAHSGTINLRDLRAQHVERWIAALVKEGHPYDTRRHWLLWLRRACAIAPRHGLPNPIAGVKNLDRREGRPVASATTLTLVQLCTHIRENRKGDDPRIPALLAVMGLCGLSPSEAIRLNVGDLAGGILRVGNQGAKNSVRHRRLPLPGTVRRLCAPLLSREDGAPLFIYGRLHGSARMDLYKAAHLVTPAVGISPKMLRKTFATIAVWELGIEERFVEAFMGHAVSGLAPISNRAYLSLASVRALQPTADKIDAAVTKHLPDLAEHSDWSI